MRILIAGGGTGGHTFPAISLASKLRALRRQADILLVGSKREEEIKILTSSTFRYRFMPIGRLGRPFSVQYFISLVRLFICFVTAFKILLAFKPDVVVGFGGYISGPLLLAAVLIKRPTVIHEQNIIAGSTNRLLSHVVRKVAVNFPHTAGFSRQDITVTGNPLRESIYKAGQPGKGLFNLLVVGGSQGSFSINSMVINALAALPAQNRQRLQVIHLTGASDYHRVADAYADLRIQARLYPFLTDMGSAYATADLVIARAGATTISEINALGLPSILIPYPLAGGHQRSNAEFLRKQEAAVVVEQGEMHVEKLKKHLLSFMKSRSLLQGVAERSRVLGRRDGAERLARIVMEAAA